MVLRTNWKRSDRQVICDVCGFVYRLKDVVKVTDKYNKYFGLVICKKDARSSKTNPQSRPFKYKEIIVTNPLMIRGRPDVVYQSNLLDDRLPGPPLNGQALRDPVGSVINLFWSGPYDTGSSGITGYKIQVASPQKSNYSTLIADTGNAAPVYQDTITALTDVVSYKVAAINSFGTGPYSAEFFWPTQQVSDSIIYIGINGGTSVLATSDGVPIVLSPEV